MATTETQQVNKLSGGQRSLLGHAQRVIEDYYGVERRADVVDFAHVGEQGAREALLIRENADALELRLQIPRCDGKRTADSGAQLVEGVSHFVYVAERARTGLPTTQLELELQAEVDKFVVYGLEGLMLRPHELQHVHRGLFEGARFLHAPHTTEGGRYRLAHRLAARYLSRVVKARARSRVRADLNRFYRCGQAEKISLARAA